MFNNRCPLCGTSGKSWNKEAGILQCPNCESIFSPFGLIVESEKEFDNVCT